MFTVCKFKMCVRPRTHLIGLALSIILSLCGTCCSASDGGLRIVTYNIHGGLGPDGQGDLESNLTAFRDEMLQGEDVVCLQEVPIGSGWSTVGKIFSEYPHAYQTVNTTTAFVWPWQSRKKNSVAILSKHPFQSTDSRLIQIDPQIDKWERNAQHVRIELDGRIFDIFNFHNTYNFDENDWKSEKAGLRKFRDYVLDRIGVETLAQAENLLMLGDFNLYREDVAEIVPTPAHSACYRDHVCTIPPMEYKGWYPTYTEGLSDHYAVWAELFALP